MKDREIERMKDRKREREKERKIIETRQWHRVVI